MIEGRFAPFYRDMSVRVCNAHMSIEVRVCCNDRFSKNGVVGQNRASVLHYQPTTIILMSSTLSRTFPTLAIIFFHFFSEKLFDDQFLAVDVPHMIDDDLETDRLFS